MKPNTKKKTRFLTLLGFNQSVVVFRFVGVVSDVLITLRMVACGYVLLEECALIVAPSAPLQMCSSSVYIGPLFLTCLFSPFVPKRARVTGQHVCKKGRAEFKLSMQRDAQVIKDCLTFSGPPDPLRGEEIYRKWVIRRRNMVD